MVVRESGWSVVIQLLGIAASLGLYSLWAEHMGWGFWDAVVGAFALRLLAGENK